MGLGWGGKWNPDTMETIGLSGKRINRLFFFLFALSGLFLSEKRYPVRPLKSPHGFSQIGSSVILHPSGTLKSSSARLNGAGPAWKFSGGYKGVQSGKNPRVMAGINY
jgi:hypothetical protein